MAGLWDVYGLRRQTSNEQRAGLQLYWHGPRRAASTRRASVERGAAVMARGVRGGGARGHQVELEGGDQRGQCATTLSSTAMRPPGGSCATSTVVRVGGTRSAPKAAAYLVRGCSEGKGV